MEGGETGKKTARNARSLIDVYNSSGGLLLRTNRDSGILIPMDDELLLLLNTP